MGAKSWFIAYWDRDPKLTLAEKPALDRDASLDVLQRLYPGARFDPAEDGRLTFLDPEDEQVLVGCYDGLKIVAHADLAMDYPSDIRRRWLDTELGSTAYLHATHSVVDWFAYGLWRNGRLVRALSLSPGAGVLEQVGEPFPLETTYWSGEHPVEHEPGEQAYPLPFHPLALAEASLLHHLGFQFEGNIHDWVCDPYDIPILSFALK